MRITGIGIVALVVGLVGCTPTYVARWISVEKDAEGKVMKTTENEAILQTISGRDVVFDYIRIVERKEPPKTESIFKK